MREILVSIIIIVALLSYFNIISTALCVHTTSDSYCTREHAAAKKGTP